MEKRKENRQHQHLVVQVVDTDPPIRGRSMDVSPSGIRIRMSGLNRLSRVGKLHLLVKANNKPYRLEGAVRWYVRDLLSDSQCVGIRFSALNYAFCRDVLCMEIGSPDLPFLYHYETREAFNREYLDNIIFGGLFLKNQDVIPPLHKKVFVQLAIADRETCFTVDGQVVVHADNGFGIKINDLDDLKSPLNKWMES